MSANAPTKKSQEITVKGVWEGAARHGGGERLDQRGMRWVKDTAESVLLLRCLEVNGDGDDFWRWPQPQRQERLEKGEALQIRSRDPTQRPQAA